MKTYYKVLQADGSACHGGRGKWPLPQDGKPGEWTPFIERVVPCKSGYHVCEKADLVHWLGPAIFTVEVRGETVRDEHKTVAQQARLIKRLDTWNERTQRLFAVDCATRALNAEKKAGRTPDPRSYEALKVARKFAKGEASYAELSAAESAARAAESAAESAAWSAAESAAESAAWSAAESAAWSAAWSAAESAAWSAARAAESAEQKWQQKRLYEYLSGKRG